jgi:hypothetical protein
VFDKIQNQHDAFHRNFSSDEMYSAMPESECLKAFGDDE